MSDKDTISIKVKIADAARFAAESRGVAIEIDGMGDAAERANRKSRGAGGGFQYMQKSMKLFKPLAIVAGLGLLVQVLNLGIAGAVGFGGAIAPLIGLLGALPAAFLIAGQGAGVLALAFSGVKGALGGLNGELEPKKFNALSAPAQRFVLLLDSMKGSVRQLQSHLQAGLFSGLTKGLEAAKPALGVLMKPLEGTAKVIGSFGDRLGHLVGSGGFLSDLRSQANFNNVQLNRLGGAGLHVVDALRQIMVASRPLISWLVKLAAGWAATADKTLTADRHNGKLAKTFQTIERVTSSVFKIFGNLGKALFNVGNIGRKSLGESLLTSLVKGSESLKKWTESGPGVAKITTFFERAKPVVYAFANLIGAAVKDFLKFGSSKGANQTLTGFFNQLRTEVLPQLLKVTEGVTRLFELVTSNVPGGGWLLTFGYALHKLGGGSLIGGIAQGLGKQFGIRMGIGLAESGAAAAIGTTFGEFFVGAAVAYIAVHFGGELAKKIHISFHPGNLLLGKSPFEITTPQGVNPSAQAKLEPGNKIAEEHNRWEALTHPFKTAGRELVGPLGRESPVEKQFHYLNHPAVKHPQHKGAALHGPTLRAPATAQVRRSGSPGHGGAATHVQTHITLNLKDKPLAEATHEFVARDGALD